LFSEGLTTALTSSETECVVTLLIWIWKAILLEVTFWFEDIRFGEFARMTVDSPNITLKSATAMID
jgi:hypothetical protein